VLALVGATPVFRDIRPGSSGNDIQQLQAGLAHIGFNPGESDGRFGPGTKAAVVEWYRSLGYQPMPTATDLAEQTSVANGRVRDAQAALDAARSALAGAQSPVPTSVRLGLEADVADKAAAFTTAQVEGAADVAVAQATRDEAAAAVVSQESAGDASSSTLAEARAHLTSAETALAASHLRAEQAVAAAQRAVAVAKAASDERLAPPELSDQRRAVQVAAAALTAEQAAVATLARESGPMIPLGELVFIPTAPAVVDQIEVQVGETAKEGWLRLASSELVVSTTLTAANRALLPLGSPVVVDDEVSGASFTGTLERVSDRALTADNSGLAGFQAVIKPDAPIGQELSGRDVRVTITGASSNAVVLVVPLSAVFARADGSVVVTRILGERRVDVTVRAGLSASGFVAVTPATGGRLAEGDRVLVAEVPAHHG
jgi:multidrug efflux pump subunit AcrA (membrane-fusion protein)